MEKPAKPAMDCVDVEEARARGRPLTGEAAAHAEACPVCTAAPRASASDATTDLLFTRIETAVAEEQGLAAWLRARPTEVRVLLAAAVAAGLAGATALAVPRAARGPSAFERVALVVTVLATLLSVVLRLGLRPLHSAPPGDAGRRVGVYAAFAAPFLFAMLPVASGAHLDAVAGVSTGRANALCFSLGITVGALLMGVLYLLDRGAHRSREAPVLAAAAGGLAGNLALELHCPITAASHLLVAHAMVGVALVVAYGAIAPRRR